MYGILFLVAIVIVIIIRIIIMCFIKIKCFYLIIKIRTGYIKKIINTGGESK